MRHLGLGICAILCTLYFHVVLFTSSDSSNLLLSSRLFTARKFYLLNCSVYSSIFMSHSVTGSKASASGRVGSGRVTGQRFRPGSISDVNIHNSESFNTNLGCWADDVETSTANHVSTSHSTYVCISHSFYGKTTFSSILTLLLGRQKGHPAAATVESGDVGTHWNGGQCTG